MAIFRFLYRLVGMLWLFIGFLFLLLATIYIIAYTVINDFLLKQPILPDVVGPWISQFAPGVQHFLGFLFASFCLLIGFGLLSLKSWARTVGVVFNIVMGFCVAALTATVFLQLRAPGLIQDQIPQFIPFVIAFLGAAFALVLLVVGFHLSTPTAMDTFSGFVPSPPPLPPIKCPTCGGVMDLAKGICPKCDTDLELSTAPTRAKLTHAQSNKEFQVSTRRPTRIGREMPGFEIQLDDPSVSGEHALIEFVDGHFYLHALKDTNGTYVNDMNRRIRDTEIRNNDIIVFGRAQFRFTLE